MVKIRDFLGFFLEFLFYDITGLISCMQYKFNRVSTGFSQGFVKVFFCGV